MPMWARKEWNTIQKAKHSNDKLTTMLHNEKLSD